MTPTPSTASQQAWALIEQERRRDRTLRRISITAWTITFVLVLVFAVFTVLRLIEFFRLMGDGGPLTMNILLGAATPLLAILGVLAVLIATLSTVGIFLRMRTASLTEIQLRLAALEEIIAARKDMD
jgi:hypothetical protein